MVPPGSNYLNKSAKAYDLMDLAPSKRKEDDDMRRAELLALARGVAQRAHCPYSHFRVGVAVLADGKTYVGVNVEISSYGLTLCAERSALAAAVSDGVSSITHIAVACIDVPPGASIGERTPCGACRQWLADLAPGAVIYIDGVERDFSVADLLPYAFALQEGEK